MARQDLMNSNYSNCADALACTLQAAAVPHRGLPGSRCTLALAVSAALTFAHPGTSEASLFPATIDLSTLDGSNGFAINGEAASDRSGYSLSAAGDVNGDGTDDLIIGAYGADFGGPGAGRSYVVFGSINGFPSPLELSALNGSNGFVLDGEGALQSSGRGVSGAGDINGDGIDDLLIGAPDAGPNGPSSGRGYVVFGSDEEFPSPFDLSTLDGLNGFTLDGAVYGDFTGRTLAAAGDVNGDGFDDLIIGASGADINGTNTGRSHVVFGSDQGFPSNLDLSTLNGTNGFALNGELAGTQFGWPVSGAGDINDDGFDDLAIGAFFADFNGDASGRAYVVFGTDEIVSTPFEVSTLNGSNGFVVDGEAMDAVLGRSLAAAGDVNGDGIDDLFIGARGALANGSRPGRGYVIFGSTAGFASAFDLSTLDGLNGFVLNGRDPFERTGTSVDGGGDINGDGIADLIIGATFADPNGANAGRAYVVFGSNDGFAAEIDLAELNGGIGFALNGAEEGDQAGRAVSFVGDVNGDGVDDLLVSADRAAANGSNSGRSYLVFGRAALFADRFESN